VFVAKVALDEDDLFLRHKSTVRTHLDAGWKDAEARGGFHCIFVNRRGDLAQGGRMSARGESYSSERTKESTNPAAVLSATVGPPCS